MFFLKDASKARLREAESARRNRLEVIKAVSTGQITRRDLVRMGLMTAGGLWVLKHGLSPFAGSAYARSATGNPPSPIRPGIAFTQPMPRLIELARKPVPNLSIAPTRLANQMF